MLVAVAALVLAMAGGAWALPGRGKVDANDLAKNSVGPEHPEIDYAALAREGELHRSGARHRAFALFDRWWQALSG